MQSASQSVFLSSIGGAAIQNDADMDVDTALIARLQNVQHIVTVLSTLLITKKQLCTVEIDESGITFRVEEKRMLMAKAKLDKDMFDEFVCNQETTFGLNLSTLLECFNMFGSNSLVTAMKMVWKGYGNQVEITLQDNAVQCFCQIRTLDLDDELMDFPVDQNEYQTKAVMTSSALKEAFRELDWSSSVVTIVLSPDPPHFHMQTVTPAGSCSVNYPKTSGAFISFESESTQEHSYYLSMLNPSVKALGAATKTQLLLNDAGVLSLQLLIKTQDGRTAFVDFFILAKIEEDDE